MYKTLLLICTILFTTFLIGCLVSSNPDDPQSVKLFVTESDFQSGLLEWIGLSNDSISTGNISIHSDSRVLAYEGFVYVLERYGADNVLKFDPSKSDASGVVYQTHLGDNWNPQDIEFISDTKAYITLLSQPKIAIFNPTTGTVTGFIDISAYTFNPDSNSSPYANQMVGAEGNVFVLLQRRDGWVPGAPSMILTVDPSTDQIALADTLVCTYKNGYDLSYVDGALYVTNPGSSFSNQDGAIEKIDLATKTATTIITEQVLGGSPNQIIHASGTRFYVQNYEGWKQVSVIEIDAATGAIVKKLPSINDAFGGIYFDDTEQRLYVGERDSVNIGIRIFENNTLIAGPIRSNHSLPPTSMVMVRQ